MSGTTPDTIAVTWKPSIVVIAILLGCIGYFYTDTLTSMANIWWRSETYTHGLVVPPIALWLIWRHRKNLEAIQPIVTLWPLIPTAAFVLFWLLGEITAVNSLTQFSLIGILIFSLMALLGSSVSKKIAFPLFFLFFAVPIGDFLLPQLMEWTADFTVLALRITGIPVYREGQDFIIPSGHWSVVEACSGIRYLIASITVGTLYAYLTYSTLEKRLLFIVISLVVPIFSNWLRAYLIVMLGHLSGNKLAAGVDHLVYGWVFFGAVIAVMFSIGMRWADSPSSNKENAQQPIGKAVNYRTKWWPFVLVVGVVAGGPLISTYLKQINTPSTIDLSSPLASHSWEKLESVIDWRPNYEQPSAEIFSTYQNKNTWVGMYIAYYKNQNQNNKLITSTNTLINSGNSNWQTVSSTYTSAFIAEKTEAIRETELLKKQGNFDDRYIVWQWYWINGQITTSDMKAKLLTALSIITGNGDDSATIILISPKVSANQALTSFTSEMGDEISRSLKNAKAK